jgi:hypothetical protein
MIKRIIHSTPLLAGFLILICVSAFTQSQGLKSTGLPIGKIGLSKTSGNISDIGLDNPPGSNYNSAADSLFARFTIQPSATDKNYMNQLIVDLKNYGLWYRLDVLYIFAIGTDSIDALLNWRSPSFNCTKTNSVPWIAYQGFTPNGSTSYINSNWNPYTSGVNYVLNSASGGVYVRTNPTPISGDNNYDMGLFSAGANAIEFNIRYYGTNLYFAKLNSTLRITYSNSNSIGFWIDTRKASDSVFVYKNGLLFFKNALVSTGIYSSNLFIGSANNNGSAYGYANKQYSAVFFGNGFSATDAANISTAINAYMTSIGTNVY